MYTIDIMASIVKYNNYPNLLVKYAEAVVKYGKDVGWYINNDQSLGNPKAGAQGATREPVLEVENIDGIGLEDGSTLLEIKNELDRIHEEIVKVIEFFNSTHNKADAVEGISNLIVQAESAHAKAVDAKSVADEAAYKTNVRSGTFTTSDEGEYPETVFTRITNDPTAVADDPTDVASNLVSTAIKSATQNVSDKTIKFDSTVRTTGADGEPKTKHVVGSAVVTNVVESKGGRKSRRKRKAQKSKKVKKSKSRKNSRKRSRRV
jgi:hypothetical protein